MRKILVLGACLFLYGIAKAEDFPPVQIRGAVQQTTTTAIIVTTTPVIVLSTGTNMFSRTANFTFNTSSWNNQVVITTVGQVMSERIYVEFFNDTSTEVWLGYAANVSTNPGANYGRRLPPGSSWSNDGAIRDYWVVCATTTLQKFVITQQK